MERTIFGCTMSKFYVPAPKMIEKKQTNGENQSILIKTTFQFRS